MHIKIIYNPELLFMYTIYTLSANLANWYKLFSEWILTFCSFVIDYEHKEPNSDSSDHCYLESDFKVE